MRPNRSINPLTVLAWAFLVATGVATAARYGQTAGPPPVAPPAWPADTRLAFDPGRPNVLLFLHPRCPCSRASLNALGRVLESAPTKPTARVVVTWPAGAPADWADTDVVALAASTPGVSVVNDRDGTAMVRFGVHTSGDVLAYSADGRLLFRGGITAARGHDGDAAGQDLLRAALGNAPSTGPADPVPTTSAPAFGCPLAGDRCPTPEGAPACPR